MRAGAEMHHIPDVDLVHQNSTNRAVIPRIRIGQNNIRGKGSKLFMQVRLWAENLLYYVLFISIGIHAGNASKYGEFRNQMIG